MQSPFAIAVICLWLATASWAAALHIELAKRWPAPQVDLDYAIYAGVSNTTTSLNVFKGIRFAAPPTGSLRWQPPQKPAGNRSATVQATAFGPACPQSLFSLGAFGVNHGVLGDEDCLFLNVYAPSNASNLPVLVWIHGGGYGAGNGQEDLSAIINTNKNSFIGVSIQYRLGAFGFLSSDEVFRNGVVNAGILDQHFALEWVQKYIHLFGGDPSRVTISGESAGGGSVMLHTMAYGGTIGDSLFVNSIAASPYLPMQYGYKDWIPSQSIAASPYLPMQYGYKDWIPSQAYYAFALQAGCPPKTAYGSSPQTIFECLVAKDTATLQNASFNVSASGVYGTWAFLPVTDGTYIRKRPSKQLLQKQVNGKRMLTGNNALEGLLFVPQNIATEDDLLAWIRLTFPLFTNDDIAKLLAEYSYVSSPQERADDIYGETTFVCPSYWLAEAYSGDDRRSYKYQYSVPVALHATDVSAYFGPPTPNQGPDFVLAFMSIWGDFITANNPSIPNSIANGASSSSPAAANPASNWPAYSRSMPNMINLNETGGTPFTTVGIGGINVTEDMEPGLRNNISLVDAATWENGRGGRCDFWRSIGAEVPE